ncbi:MAG: c-type cytochrome [Planctomycetes bacterium]|nr:c-type cytochrome [Planctomycetota bacterium]
MKLTSLSVCLLCAAFASTALAQEAERPKFFTQAPAVMRSVEAGLNVKAEPAAELAPVDWEAGPAPAWIWGPKDRKRYFLHAKFKGGTKAARLKTCCDNHVTVLLNGQQVAHSDDWAKPVDVDVQSKIRPGTNELLLEVKNDGGIAACILKLVLTRADGKIDYLVTDDKWQVGESRDDKELVSARVIGKLGTGPWGNPMTKKPAAGPTEAPSDVFSVLPGFQVEKLFTVPKDQAGSWVNLTVDEKGRLIASDEKNFGLYRITPPAIGSQDQTKVEHLDVKVPAAHGLLFAFGSLYVCANSGGDSGIYRLRDMNNDDQFDSVEKLFSIRGAGEHGPHALRLAPDGKSIYVLAGNHTRPPFDPVRNAAPQTMGGVRTEPLRATLPEHATSRLAPNWDEDLLLPRQWDAGGHAVGILAPGGWIAKIDPEAKDWELLSVGYRNAFDMALNADGEIFAYDADMEWDFGAPWYRPTRVCHATSGSEFGWRSGTGKWSAYFADSLPPVVNIGPGSPVGVEFGYGAKFPSKYQKALYLLDWTYGTMYAIHLEPTGSTYVGQKEEFLSRGALPLTDAVVGRDGALYFTVGGRGTQSELFRATYVGKEATSVVDVRDARQADTRALRHKIEQQHTATPSVDALPMLVENLAHHDRFVRYAARVALERYPVEKWQAQVLNSNQFETVVTGALGLARAGDRSLQPKLLAALDRFSMSGLDEFQSLELLRAYELVFIRLGAPTEAERAALGTKFEDLFPHASDWVNRELANLMVYLESPHAARKLVPLLNKPGEVRADDLNELIARNPRYGGAIAAMQANKPDAQQIQFVFALRNLKTGWTLDLHKEYFRWFTKAHTWSGGNSFQKFLTNIDNDAFANVSEKDRVLIESSGARQPYVPPELPKPKGPGQAWTLAEIVALQPKLANRNYNNGKKMFAATRCIVCHRFAGEGGATGPDLTQLAGRFNLKDLTESIVDPSKIVSDQYRASIIQTNDGQVITGRVVSETDDALVVVINPEDSSKIATVKKQDIESQAASPISLMPKDLLNVLNQNEVLDLLAYLLSRGNPQDPLFGK